MEYMGARARVLLNLYGYDFSKGGGLLAAWTFTLAIRTAIFTGFFKELIGVNTNKSPAEKIVKLSRIYHFLPGEIA